MNRGSAWLRYSQSTNLLSVPVVSSTTFVMVLLFSAGAAVNQTGNSLGRTLLMVCGSVAMFAFIAAFRFIVIDRLPPRISSYAVVVGALVGAALGSVTYMTALAATGIEENVDIVSRASGSTLMIAIFALAANAAVSSLRARHTVRERMRAEELRMLEIERDSVDASGDLDSAVVAKIRSDIEQALDESHFTTGMAALSALQACITMIVKPASSLLEESREKVRVPDLEVARDTFSWRWVLMSSFDTKYLRPAVPLAIGSLLVLPYLTRTYGIWPGLISQAAFLSINLLITLALKRLMSTVLPSASKFTLLPVATVASTSAVLVASALPGAIPVSGASMVFLVALYVFVSYAISVVRFADDAGRAGIQDLEGVLQKLAWRVTRLRATRRQMFSRVSHVLHSQIQARLAATYLHISKAVNRGSATRQFLNVQRHWALASLALLDDVNERMVPLKEIVTATKATWVGLATVSSLLSHNDMALLESDPVCSATISELIPELCFNSINHGGATAVSISLTRETDDIVDLRITDDGRSRPESGRVGLGTLLLRDCSISWERRSTPGGSETIVRLPFRPA